MRIVSGSKKGTKLYGFEQEESGKRATLDHVKEAIFDKIQFLVTNSIVLDLFAGTGSLGLECMSRGAKEVTLVEKDNDSLKIIRKNCDKLGFSPIIIQNDYDLALKKMQDKQFDLIFLDPPFESHYGQKALMRIAKLHRLKNDGLIIYEHREKTTSYPTEFVVVDEKTYGTIVVTYLRIKDGSNL